LPASSDHFESLWHDGTRLDDPPQCTSTERARRFLHRAEPKAGKKAFAFSAARFGRCCGPTPLTSRFGFWPVSGVMCELDTHTERFSECLFLPTHALYFRALGRPEGVPEAFAPLQKRDGYCGGTLPRYRLRSQILLMCFDAGTWARSVWPTTLPISVGLGQRLRRQTSIRMGTPRMGPVEAPCTHPFRAFGVLHVRRATCAFCCLRIGERHSLSPALLVAAASRGARVEWGFQEASWTRW